MVIGNEGNIFIIYIRPYKNSSSNEKLFDFMYLGASLITRTTYTILMESVKCNWN